MKVTRRIELAALVAALAIAWLPSTANAYVTTGGVWDKVSGSHYGKRSNRATAGKKKYTAKKRKKKYAKKKYRSNYASAGRYSAGPRPKRWCGWWMRTQLGGGPKFNVAWNWRHYGRPTSPQIGAVVVWRHHVGMIVGQTSDGRWIVRSGNDSNRVRTRARSVKGAIFRI